MDKKYKILVLRNNLKYLPCYLSYHKRIEKKHFFVILKKLFRFDYLLTKGASERRQKKKFSYLTIWKIKNGTCE